MLHKINGKYNSCRPMMWQANYSTGIPIQKKSQLNSYPDQNKKTHTNTTSTLRRMIPNTTPTRERKKWILLNIQLMHEIYRYTIPSIHIYGDERVFINVWNCNSGTWNIGMREVTGMRKNFAWPCNNYSPFESTAIECNKIWKVRVVH